LRYTRKGFIFYSRARITALQNYYLWEEKKMDTNRLMNQREAAEFLGLSTAWLERARWQGNGPRYIKFGRACRYRLADIEKYLVERERLSTSDKRAVA
jgi:predicted DNA-binding transcriptional regulator AlpA